MIANFPFEAVGSRFSCRLRDIPQATAPSGLLRFAAMFLSAAALFLITPKASADTAVGLGWQDLTFTLTALDPNDGIGPWLHASRYKSDHFGASIGPSNCCDMPVVEGFRLPSSLEDRFSSHFMFLIPETDFWFQTMTFEISPNTRLTITGNLIAESSGPADKRIQVRENTYWDFHTDGVAEASASLGNDTASVRSINGRNVQSFAFVVENSTDVSPTYALNLNLRGSAGSSGPVVVNVPEPGTYALMLAGLGALGVALRRRNDSAV